MAWFQNFLLGIEGSELEILAKILTPNFELKNVEQLIRNISGGLRRDIIKHGVDIVVLQTAAVPESTLARLRGYFQSKAVLNFKMNDALIVTDQLEISSDATHVTLTNTALTGMTISGIFLKSDVARALTNYFSGGSFNGTTFVATLGSPLPGANTEVWVDYAYTGQSVMLTRLNAVPHEAANKDLWKVTVELTGA